MASSSSDPQSIHDVFLNFRWEDTRDNFVSHLHAALSNKKINTFLDDQLHKGKEVGPELLRAIEGSQISLVIFSEKYAGSCWCLDELVKIMECHRTYGQVVIPIYYHVDPSIVRRQKGAFGKALEATAKNRVMQDVLSRWRSALTQAANISGWDASTIRNDDELVTLIVEEVSKILYNIVSITEFPVGLESHVQKVTGFIENQASKVCMIGIWGMGGSGKTTLAKAIYNQILQQFVHRSFIENIREVCEIDNGGIIYLQEQLLYDVLKTKEKIQSIASGTNLIQKRLRGKRTLVILDDVTMFEQLDALCVNPIWFGFGSVLIVTTRDVCILNELKVTYVCTMKEMDKNKSLELFSWHAFREPSPREDFSELSMKVVAYCGGLPLALEFLGSYLHGRTKSEWKSLLSKLERIPNDQVQEKLRISYDALKDNTEKDVFLDICCFFIGKDRAYVTEILDGCGLCADIGIVRLIEQGLLKVEKNNKLQMHDLLRDMGREIVRQSSIKEPGKRSRLWCHGDVQDVLTNNTGTETIEGLVLNLQSTRRVCFSTNSFKEMKKLRLLQLDCVDLIGDFGYLSKQLRWVNWQGFALKCIPNDLYQENLVVIDFKHSNLKQVWKETKLLEKLKILNLSHSKYLKSTPDFSKLPNLEKLIMKDCPSLSKVHPSIGDLNNILLINLKDCTSLSNLPRKIYQLKSLKTLIFSGCSKIDKLEEDIMQMESLTTLIAKNTTIKEVPYSIVTSKNIGYISLCGYEGLSCDVFPSLIWSWMSPTMNSLSHISPFGGMSFSLVSLDVESNNLRHLLPMLSSLSKLRRLQVRCNSEIQLTQELRRFPDDLYDAKFTELETSHASQISDLSLRSFFIGMGNYHKVIDTLSKSISQGLTTNDSSDSFLPGDNYPSWCEGPSVHFQVPKDSDRHMKGIILCVVYSSTSENIAIEYLTSVLIINYTKLTVQIYEQDKIMSFNDEDWQGVLSNLGVGDNVEILVAFGHGLTVKKTGAYLIYGPSITMEVEPLTDVKMEPSPEVNVQPAPEVKMEPSPNVKTEPSPKEEVQPSANVKMELSFNVKKEPLMSSSSSNSQWIFDVYISFRGEETCRNFVSHLYTALSNAGVSTFLDDKKFRTGKDLQQVEAIGCSQIIVVVFSNKYAESGWCLDELVKIMECCRTNGQVVIPIFYNVDPTIVHQQKGDFGKALEATAKKRCSNREVRENNLLRWRSALTQAAKISGWDASTARNDNELVKKVVDDVLAKLDNKLLPVPEFPVGLEYRVKEMIQLIEDQSSNVFMLGIWGMGGTGKTTMAKAICNQIHRRFECTSFIENIREVCERDSRGHIHLQQQLLLDVLKTKEKIHSIAFGTTLIQKRLSGKRALIVLDDVTTFEQLKALCVNRKLFGSGSVLIFTTRDVHLLYVLEVDHFYKVKEMDAKESLKLFSWHAFRKAGPSKDFCNLSRKVVTYCGGLPLVLEVLGSYLYERTKPEWKSMLSKLARIPYDQVQEKLRISYNGLEDEMKKDIFLDICCFFIGNDRAYVTEILNGCGLYADIGITVLIERSLVKVEKTNKLRMHDLLRDMGREIVSQSSEKEPGKRSRLWFHEDVYDVLTKNSGTKTVEGLVLNLQRTGRACFSTKAFMEMKKLRLLQLDCVDLTGDYGHLSKQLRWVYWKGSTFKCIPDNFYQGNLVVIELKHSRMKQVWNEMKLLDKLKILNLSHSWYLKNTPDFSKLPNLEKLIMKDCPSLSEVHQSIGDLSNLLLINLKDCTSLSNLPRKIYQLKSVTTLILSGCSKIDKLEEDIVQMDSLTTLNAKDTAIKEVPYSIVMSKSIGYISLCGYEGLSRDVFPSLIWSWMTPTMNSLPHIPLLGGMSSSLVSLDVESNNLGPIHQLPMLGALSNLRSLQVRCNSEIQQTQEIRRFIDDSYDMNFTGLETTSHASQTSDLSLRSLLIGMGSYHIVIDTIANSISQGLITNDSSDLSLPGDNYPSWLAYTCEGPSVLFKVPEDSDCHMKGIILCVVYSSKSEIMAAECLTNVLIINYTKCTIHIYKRDTVMSFNDEDWRGVTSNLGSGDNVEIFVLFGHGLTVKVTTVYLIYAQSVTMEIEPSITIKVEPSTYLKMEPSVKVNVQPSPNVKIEPLSKPNKSIYKRLAKRMGECLCLN